ELLDEDRDADLMAVPDQEPRAAIEFHDSVTLAAMALQALGPARLHAATRSSSAAAATRWTASRTGPGRGGSARVVNQCSGRGSERRRFQNRPRSTVSAASGSRAGTGKRLSVPQTPAQQRATDQGL